MENMRFVSILFILYTTHRPSQANHEAKTAYQSALVTCNETNIDLQVKNFFFFILISKLRKGYGTR